MSILQKMGIRKILYRLLIAHYFKKGTLLDVGSGDGEFLDVCKEVRKPVLGVDIEPTRKDILKWDITKKGFSKKHGRFDYLLCSQIIEHFNNDELLKFINEVCKKRVVIITQIERKRFWYEDGVPAYKTKYGHQRPYTLIELDYKMGEIGFKPIFKLKGVPIKWLDSIIWIGERKK